MGGLSIWHLLIVLAVVVLVFGAWRVAVWWRRARAAVHAAQGRGEDVPVRVRLGRWDMRPERAAA